MAHELWSTEHRAHGCRRRSESVSGAPAKADLLRRGRASRFGRGTLESAGHASVGEIRVHEGCMADPKRARSQERPWEVDGSQWRLKELALAGFEVL